MTLIENHNTNDDLNLSVSQLVAVVNQNLDFALNGVSIIGELANLKISKNRWIYFDLKDDNSTVRFFGSVYALPGPLEDGMVLKVVGTPRLHNKYGFSVNVQNISLAGEGSIKRAAELLKAKLHKEGLFDLARKRPLPYPPQRIGLIASRQSAAYADFVKIINARWSGLEIDFIDVQVQGDVAPEQITKAIELFNEHSNIPEILVLIRGGGSAEDLAAFNTEQVTRAVAGSRIPTLVAIGHEIDISLAELAADCRASTPSNAAELIVPDKRHTMTTLQEASDVLRRNLEKQIADAQAHVANQNDRLSSLMDGKINQQKKILIIKNDLLEALSPTKILKKGYSIVYHNGQAQASVKNLKTDDKINIKLHDGELNSVVELITRS